MGVYTVETHDTRHIAAHSVRGLRDCAVYGTAHPSSFKGLPERASINFRGQVCSCESHAVHMRRIY